ncbi:putative oxalocrotonate tautomerase enzyme-domain-containing protein [Halenospora varia]|nr:putative oxalocrotonate tautomerase enzyme-domain-containing protein [Halenospora varia]
MPLLKFYITPGQLTSAEKQDLATTLTSRYAKIMPAFFVNVVFHEVCSPSFLFQVFTSHLVTSLIHKIPGDSFFIGGLPTNGKFVRLTLEHIALNFPNTNGETHPHAKGFLDFIGDVMKEKFESRGWRWEYNIVESDKRYWRIQSIEPPPLDSEAIKVWDREQRGVEWREKL